LNVELTYLADVAWPSLYLESKLLSIVPITAGLIAEWLVLRYAFGLGWKKSLEVDFGMNVISTLAGLFLIPLTGVFGVFLGPAIWIYTFLIAVLITTGIEAVS
jgi:hypothetical protein